MGAPEDVMVWEELVVSVLKRIDLHRVIQPALVLAMIWQESSGNPYAYNPEQRYRWFMNVNTRAPFRRVTEAEIHDEYPPKDFPCLDGDPDQEWWAQQASWGLMQLMGSAARERGFYGSYLTELVVPPINLEYSIKHLWIYAYKRGGVELENALLNYNGGGDREYDDKVLWKMREVEKSIVIV